MYINRAEICAIFSADERFIRIGIELADLGDRCRILPVADVVEPRTKIPKAGAILDPMGQGRTCVFRGAAVVLSDYSEKGEVTTPTFSILSGR